MALVQPTEALLSPHHRQDISCALWPPRFLAPFAYSGGLSRIPGAKTEMVLLGMVVRYGGPAGAVSSISRRNAPSLRADGRRESCPQQELV